MRIATILLLSILLLNGCSTSPPWHTEADLTEGDYRIAPWHPSADFLATNGPLISVYECGRMRVETQSNGSYPQASIHLDWTSGKMTGRYVASNGALLLDFVVECDGTNVTLRQKQNPQRRVEQSPPGDRLRAPPEE